jgi:hypothetical protein
MSTYETHHDHGLDSFVEWYEGSLRLNGRRIVLDNPFLPSDTIEERDQKYTELCSAGKGVNVGLLAFIIGNQQYYPPEWEGERVIFPGSRFSSTRHRWHMYLHRPDPEVRVRAKQKPIIEDTDFKYYRFAVFE